MKEGSEGRKEEGSVRVDGSKFITVEGHRREIGSERRMEDGMTVKVTVTSVRGVQTGFPMNTGTE